MCTYTTNDVCKILHMSKPTILRYMKEGLLPRNGPGGRGGVRFTQEEIKRVGLSRNIVPDYAASGKPCERDRKLVILKLKVVRALTKYRMTRELKDKILLYDALIAIEEYRASKERGED